MDSPVIAPAESDDASVVIGGACRTPPARRFRGPARAAAITTGLFTCWLLADASISCGAELTGMAVESAALPGMPAAGGLLLLGLAVTSWHIKAAADTTPGADVTRRNTGRHFGRQRPAGWVDYMLEKFAPSETVLEVDDIDDTSPISVRLLGNTFRSNNVGSFINEYRNCIAGHGFPKTIIRVPMALGQLLYTGANKCLQSSMITRALHFKPRVPSRSIIRNWWRREGARSFENCRDDADAILSRSELYRLPRNARLAPKTFAERSNKRFRCTAPDHIETILALNFGEYLRQQGNFKEAVTAAFDYEHYDAECDDDLERGERDDPSRCAMFRGRCRLDSPHQSLHVLA